MAKCCDKESCIPLSNGVKMPRIGLGTWQSTGDEVKTSVKAAIKIGYRLIDMAASYGNEEDIGGAVAECIKEGLVTRDELFITTKAWTNELDPKRIEEGLRRSLKKLHLDKVDLYLAHMPAAFDDSGKNPLKDVKVEDVWRGFEHVYELGLARAVGVSNWNDEQIERAMKNCKTPIHVSQVEMHLYFPQHKHQETCKKHHIALTSYASLGSPGRANFKPAGQKLNWDEAPSELEDKNVKALAEKYKKSPAQILLRYVLERGAAIIPKSVHEKRVRENFELFDFSLSPEEVKQLEKHDHNKRLFMQDFMEGHPEDPFANERK